MRTQLSVTDTIIDINATTYVLVRSENPADV